MARIKVVVISFIIIFFITKFANAQWNNINSGVSDFLFGEYFLNNDTGFVYGDGVVLKTTNGGVNWNSSTTSITSQYTAMSFVNDSIGFLIGTGGVILKTVDGGGNWLIQNSPTNKSLTSVDFVDSLHGVIVGRDAQILRTSNGGQTWLQILSPYLFGDSLFHYDLRTIQFITDSIAYAAGGPNAGSTGILIQTTDGGNTWNTVFEAYDFPVFLQIEFINDTLGFASGSCHINNPFCYHSRILKTTDGGINWIEIYSCSSIELRSIDVIVNKIYSVGFGLPAIIFSPDSGATWLNQNPLNLVYPYQVFFTDSLTGYIVGDSGKVLKTTNGGVGYSELPSVLSSFIIFPNPNNGTFNFFFNPEITTDIEIFNPIGICVFKQINPASGNNQIDLQTAAKGIYLCKLNYSDGTFEIKKIILQ